MESLLNTFEIVLDVEVFISMLVWTGVVVEFVVKMERSREESYDWLCSVPRLSWLSLTRAIISHNSHALQMYSFVLIVYNSLIGITSRSVHVAESTSFR